MLDFKAKFQNLGISRNEQWIVEIKHISRIREDDLIRLIWKYSIFDSKIWLIIPNAKIRDRDFHALRKWDLFISDATDIQNLQELLQLVIIFK